MDLWSSQVSIVSGCLGGCQCIWEQFGNHEGQSIEATNFLPIFIALNPWIALIGSAQAEEFRRLYQIIPLPGEAAEFFVDSPRQILAALAKRKFILVQKGSGSCCVTPAEVVRSELRELRSAQADPRGQSVWHHVENLC